MGQTQRREHKIEQRPNAWSLENARRLFIASEIAATNERESKKAYSVDEKTWAGLDGERIFDRIDRSCCFAGSQYLYQSLRTGCMDLDRLTRLEAHLEFLAANPGVRERIEDKLTQLREVNGWRIPKFLSQELPALPASRLVLIALLILSQMSLILAIVYGTWVWMLALLLFGICCFVHHRTNLAIAPSVTALSALRRLLKVDKALYRITKEHALAAELAADLGLGDGLRPVWGLAKGGVLLDLPDFTGFLEYLKVVTLYDARFYAAKMHLIEGNRETLQKLVRRVGYLDHCLSILRLRQEFAEVISVPQHQAREVFRLTDCLHPLLEPASAQTNSIEIAKPGAMLTGLNMGGKSTFLKSVAVNALLSQTIHTVFCQSYVAPLAKVCAVTCSSDELVDGRSHFMQELLSVQALLDLACERAPCLLVIDEMFRGTNSDERVAASTAVLKYLGQRKNLLVATHDLEVLDQLPREFEHYNFSGTLSEQGDLEFDYRLKKGRCTQRNALRLMRAVGYPACVVDEAQALCANAARVSPKSEASPKSALAQ